MNKKNQRGFTLIELIVVIAIIAILAAIVLVNVQKYIGDAKLARANEDANNIEKSLTAFYAEYGDYPFVPGTSSNGTEFYPGAGEPCLTVDGMPHCLSEILKLDWNGYSASYIASNMYLDVYLWATTSPRQFECGVVWLSDSDGHNYGQKFILSDNPDCTTNSGFGDPIPFQLQPT